MVRLGTDLYFNILVARVAYNEFGIFDDKFCLERMEYPCIFKSMARMVHKYIHVHHKPVEAMGFLRKFVVSLV